jgi:WD40 repeat protein
MRIGFVLNSYAAGVHRIGGNVTYRDLLPKAMAAYATLTLASFVGVASAQQHPADDSLKRATATFPSADLILRDASHQKPKSGVQLEGGQLTITSGVGTPTAINSLSFSADGRILAAGKDFGRVAICNVVEKTFLRAIETKQGEVGAVSLSPDGKSIATSGNQDNNSVRIWDVFSGKLLWDFKLSNSPIDSLFFDDQGKWLVIGNNTLTVYIADSIGQKLIATLPGVHAVGMTPDGRALLTTDAKEFAVWSAPKWSKTQSLAKWNKFSMLLAANPAKDHIAVYESRSVRIAQISTAQIVLDRNDLVSKNFTWRPTFAAFSDDGAVLYLSLDGRLLLLGTASNDTCSSTAMYSGAAALSPDGRWFAGAKDDSILSKEGTDGVWVWSSNKLPKTCSRAGSFKAQQQ